jgi:K(+)-stimulated pyrophosphate-energized sodium pump
VESLDDQGEDPLFGLIRGFIITICLCTVFLFLVAYVCLDASDSENGSTWTWALFGLCGVVGITISLLFVFITEFYTDYRFRPVHSIAQASQTGHATNSLCFCFFFFFFFSGCGSDYGYV